MAKRFDADPTPTERPPEVIFFAGVTHDKQTKSERAVAAILTCESRDLAQTCVNNGLHPTIPLAQLSAMLRRLATRVDGLTAESPMQEIASVFTKLGGLGARCLASTLDVTDGPTQVSPFKPGEN